MTDKAKIGKSASSAVADPKASKTTVTKSSSSPLEAKYGKDIAMKVHVSAAKGELAIVKEILTSSELTPESRRQVVEHKDGGNYSRTALIQASRNGHLGVVEFLAREMGADVFARDTHELGSMAIHFAAEIGHLEVVRFLCDFKEELVEAKDHFSSTPLNLASFAGKLKVVEFLVDVKKANIENMGAYSRTPLLSAAEQGHFQVVEFLAQRGANVNAKSSGEGNEDMAIHLAAYFGHLKVVEILLSLNANLLEEKNKTNETALNRAVMGAQPNVVEFLLDVKKANIENRGEFDRTPLLQAADEGHLNIVEMLVARGANLLVKDGQNEDSPMHLAAYFNHTPIVGFLLQQGANGEALAKATNRQGLTPLALAKRQNNSDVVQLLNSKGIRA